MSLLGAECITRYGLRVLEALRTTKGPAVMKAAVANQLAPQSGRRDGSRLGAIGRSDHLYPVSPPQLLCVSHLVFFSAVVQGRGGTSTSRAATSPLHDFPLPFPLLKPGNWLAFVDVSTKDCTTT